MARIAKFRYATTDVDLDFGSGTWNTVSWVPKATVEGEDVEETPTVLVVTATDDQMATQIQLLDDLMLRVTRYRENPAYETPVWLHAKRNDETGERRAIVKRLSYTPLNAEFDCEAMQHQASYQLNITRGGWWETTATPGTGATTNLNVLGGAFDYTAAPGADIAGDGGRLGLMTVTTSLAARIYYYAWFGFRSAALHGTLANFVPRWELESATLTNDTAAGPDATASPGGAGNTKATCTFATVPTWVERATMYLTTATGGANYADNYGTFVVLLRAKMTAGTGEVRLYQLYRLDTTARVIGPIVEVASASWTMYNLGVVQIPMRDLRGIGTATIAATRDLNYALQVWARRTSGAGSLDLDCLVLIPADEYFLYVENLRAGGSDPDIAYISESPLGDLVAVSVDTATNEIQALGNVAANGDTVPNGDGRLYGVIARASKITDITDDWDPTLQVYSRWRSLRGNE